MIRFSLSIFLFFLLVSLEGYCDTIVQLTDLNRTVQDHCSVTLLDGNVLVMGGNDGDFYKGPPDIIYNSYYRSCSIYDTTTKVWSSVASLRKTRSDFGALLLGDGKVLAFGGHYYQSVTRKQYFSKSSEVFDPVNSVWGDVVSMNFEHKNSSYSKLVDGRILVVSSNRECEIYNPVQNRWDIVDSPSEIRIGKPSLTILNDGRVLLVGGGNDSEPALAEVFDPITSKWSVIDGELNVEHTFCYTSKLSSGKVLIMGDHSFSNNATVCEVFDPITNLFTQVAPMVLAANGPSILTDDGRVLVFGLGNLGTSDTKIIQIYNPELDLWSTLNTNIVGALGYSYAKLSNGEILIVGGSYTTGNGASDRVFSFNPSVQNYCISNSLSIDNIYSSCYGGGVDLNITNFDSNSKYTLENNGLVLMQNNATTTFSLGTLIPSDYKLMLYEKTVGCPKIFTGSIIDLTIDSSELDTPIVKPIGESFMCNELDIVELEVVNDQDCSVTWTNNETSKQISIDYKGSFAVQLLAKHGCKSTLSNFIRVYDYTEEEIDIDLFDAPELCASLGDYSLEASPSGGQWYFYKKPISNVLKIDTLIEGEYYVSYKVCDVSDSVDVFIESPEADLDLDYNMPKEYCVMTTNYRTLGGFDYETRYKVFVNDVLEDDFTKKTSYQHSYDFSLPLNIVKVEASKSLGVCGIDITDFRIDTVDRIEYWELDAEYTQDTFCTEGTISVSLKNTDDNAFY